MKKISELPKNSLSFSICTICHGVLQAKVMTEVRVVRCFKCGYYLIQDATTIQHQVKLHKGSRHLCIFLKEVNLEKPTPEDLKSFEFQVGLGREFYEPTWSRHLISKIQICLLNLSIRIGNMF